MADRDVSADVASTTPWVVVAEVARPHGLRGELRLKVFNPESELLEGRPPVRLRLADGTERPCELTAARRVPAGLLVRISGVSDRSAAEQLRGAVISVSRDALSALDSDEFYVCDLEGCDALLAGRRVGRVARVVSYPTCDAAVIAGDDGRELEVPLHEDFIAAVRTEDRILELRTLEGLE